MKAVFIAQVILDTGNPSRHDLQPMWGGAFPDVVVLLAFVCVVLMLGGAKCGGRAHQKQYEQLEELAMRFRHRR